MSNAVTKGKYWKRTKAPRPEDIPRPELLSRRSLTRRRLEAVTAANASTTNSTGTESLTPAQISLRNDRNNSLKRILAQYNFPDRFTRKVQYLDESALLPVKAKRGSPHLINLQELEKTDYTGLTIADMVVTVLLNHSPNTLSKFLDASRQFSYRISYPEGSRSQNLVIVRTQESVTCGYEKDHQWICKHTYAIGHGPMGIWTPELIEEATEMEGMKVVETATDFEIPETAQNMMDLGKDFAFEVLKTQPWRPESGSIFEVRDTAAWRT